MTALELLGQPIWQRWTWTLLHFLWQAFAVAGVTAIVLCLLRRKPADWRYAALVCGLAVMVACPVVTYILVDAPELQRLSAAADPAVVPRSDVTHEDHGDLNREEIHAAPVDDNFAWQTIEPRTGEPSMVADLPATVAETGNSDGLDRMAAAEQTLVWRSLWRNSQPWLIICWMCGVALLAARLLLGVLGGFRLRRQCESVPDWLTAAAARISGAMRMRCAPAVFASLKSGEALAVGLLRPIVLVPAVWITELSPEMLEAVLAHELAHIRRRDLWVNLVQRAVEAVFFFHPAVWWLSRRLRCERELCCDELAVSVTGQRVIYVSALEHLARRRLMETRPALAAGMGGPPMELLHRVRNVLNSGSAVRRPGWWPAGVLALAVPVALWQGSIGAQSNAEPRTQSSAQPEEQRLADSAETADAAATAPADEHVDRDTQVRPLDLLTIDLISVLPTDIRNGDVLGITVPGTLPGHPINASYRVRPDGTVGLGEPYGDVRVVGMSQEQAQVAIKKALQRWLAAANVSVRWIPPERTRQTRLAEIVDEDGNIEVMNYAARVRVVGLTAGGVEQVIRQIEKFPKDVRVRVQINDFDSLQIDPNDVPKDLQVRAFNQWPKGPYRIEPPDVLSIELVRSSLKGPYKVQPLDQLHIAVDGALPDQPIRGTHTVSLDGTVMLGPAYGAMHVAGQTVDEIQALIKQRLEKILTTADTSVSLEKTAQPQQLSGQYLVGPDGAVQLGRYGNVKVSGLSLDGAKKALETHLEQYFDSPEVAVSVYAYNSKVYYVVVHGGGNGDQVLRQPLTGNETVLDAIAQAQAKGLVDTSSGEIWISRPIPDIASTMRMPVDMRAIVERGFNRSNFRLLPGDRVTIALNSAARQAAADNPFGDPAAQPATTARRRDEDLLEVIQSLRREVQDLRSEVRRISGARGGEGEADPRQGGNNPARP